MTADWFRKQSWSEADQTDFWRRLTKARENNRAQYVFIQGYTLMEAGSQYGADAIALFDHVIDRYSGSKNFVQALSAKADCLFDSGDIDGALVYYDRAIEQMRIKPNVQTWAWLDFAWIVATKELSSQYDAALDVLDEFANATRPIFPVVVFRLYASRALIQSACGLTNLAMNAARAALDAANKDASGLRYHPKIGVLGTGFEDIRSQLKAIALA